jgi:hypothetical protein
VKSPSPDVDKFKDAMGTMGSMPPEHKKKMMTDLKLLCVCGSCPTYNKYAKEDRELLFCVKGMSGCIDIKRECICSTCPVRVRLGLRKDFYCLRGSERQLREM